MRPSPYGARSRIPFAAERARTIYRDRSEPVPLREFGRAEPAPCCVIAACQHIIGEKHAVAVRVSGSVPDDVLLRRRASQLRTHGPACGLWSAEAQMLAQRKIWSFLERIPCCTAAPH